MAGVSEAVNGASTVMTAAQDAGNPGAASGDEWQSGWTNWWQGFWNGDESGDGAWQAATQGAQPAGEPVDD